MYFKWRGWRLGDLMYVTRYVNSRALPERMGLFFGGGRVHA